MKAFIYLICALLQTGVVFAQSSALSPEQPLEGEIRELRERRQQLEDELARLQSSTPTLEEVEALKTGSAVHDPAPASPGLVLQAKAYHLLGALTEDEVNKVRHKDALRLASRGEDYIPQDSPVLARMAEHAGITVSAWFARLPASDVIGRIEAVRTELEPSSTGSTLVQVPQPTPTSEPEPSRGRAIPPKPAPRPPPSAPVTNTQAASARVSVGPPPAEVDGLLKHGKELFAAGDISGARALFLRAAAGSDPSALTALAQTYDPQVLGTMRVRGVKPDPTKAKSLYEQAEAARNRR